MTSVLVLGGTGMLGSMVTDELVRRPDIRLTATWRAAGNTARRPAVPGVEWVPFDGADSRLDEALSACGPHQWIINAIGITKPLIRDDDPRQVEPAIRINALLPHAIARVAETHGARVLQIA